METNKYINLIQGTILNAFKVNRNLLVVDKIDDVIQITYNDVLILRSMPFRDAKECKSWKTEIEFSTILVLSNLITGKEAIQKAFNDAEEEFEVIGVSPGFAITDAEINSGEGGWRNICNTNNCLDPNLNIINLNIIEE